MMPGGPLQPLGQDGLASGRLETRNLMPSLVFALVGIAPRVLDPRVVIMLGFHR
jgi:hypothetical protein